MRKYLTEEHKERLSKSMKGRPSNFLNKKHRSEVKKGISETMKEIWKKRKEINNGKEI